MNNPNSLKESLGLTHFKGFDFLLACTWGMGILMYYARTFVGRSPFSFLAPEFVTICVVLGIMVSLSYFKRVLKLSDIIFYLLIVIYFYACMFLYPNNKPFLEDLSFIFLIKSVPLYFIGISLNINKSYNLLRTVSAMSIIILFVVLFLMGGMSVYELEGDEGEGMGKAYALLPCVLFMIWDSFRKTSFANILLSILGVFLLLSLGTRGPIVCILAFVLLDLLLFKDYKHPICNRIVIISAGGVLYTFLTPILHGVQGLLMAAGASTRIVNSILEDTFDDSRGRDNIYSFMWEQIIKDPLSGHGLAGDRASTYASWSHNFAIEIFMTFGLVIGSAILGFLLWMLIIIIVKDIHSIHTQFTILLFCSSIVMLMLSSSFLQEPMVYLFIGYMVNILRKNSPVQNEICKIN